MVIGLSWLLLHSQHPSQDTVWGGTECLTKEEGRGGLADGQACSLSLAGPGAERTGPGTGAERVRVMNECSGFQRTQRCQRVIESLLVCKSVSA